MDFVIRTALLSLVLLMALYYDIKEKKIKNFITLPAALAGLVINGVFYGPAGLLLAFKGWIIPVLCLIFFYYINVMGAGDIKLFAAIGAIMGLPFAALSFVYTVYIGGAMAVFIMLRRKELVSKMKRVYGYFSLMLITQSVTKYCAKDDYSSKFIFSIAIVPGTIIQLFLTFMKDVTWIGIR